MTGLISLAQALGKIERTIAATEAMEHVVLEAACKTIQKGAREQIGHYQTADAGVFGPWQPLAESTLAEKERLGFAPPDNPLLRTGEMRDSVEYTVGVQEACVGSDNQIAVYQELGTVKMPARSFLGSTAFRIKNEIGKMVGYSMISTLIAEEKVVKIAE